MQTDWQRWIWIRQERIATLVESQGYRYEVYRNIDEFRKIVLEYLDSKQ